MTGRVECTSTGGMEETECRCVGMNQRGKERIGALKLFEEDE